jgi:antitoxin VapB
VALNIINKSVEQQAILASKITGKNKTATVGEALEYFLKHHQPLENDKTSNHEVLQLLLEMSELPVLDARSANEILGYDENGLAR